MPEVRLGNRLRRSGPRGVVTVPRPEPDLNPHGRELRKLAAHDSAQILSHDDTCRSGHDHDVSEGGPATYVHDPYCPDHGVCTGQCSVMAADWVIRLSTAGPLSVWRGRGVGGWGLIYGSSMVMLDVACPKVPPKPMPMARRCTRSPRLGGRSWAGGAGWHRCGPGRPGCGGRPGKIRGVRDLRSSQPAHSSSIVDQR